MVPGIDPKVDYAFKRLFAVPERRARLIDLLNAVIDPAPEHRVVEVEIQDPFNQKSYESDKLSVVDLKAIDQLGRRFVVEMQMLRYKDLPKRILFYWARLYAEQMNEAMEYSALRPAVVICFLGEPLFGSARYHRRFGLRDVFDKLDFTDDLSVHTIELSKLPASPEKLKSPLDCWSFFLQHADALDTEKLPPRLERHPQIRDAMKDLATIAQSPEERAAYERELKRQRDERFFRKMAIEEGLQEGMKEGLKEGMKEGMKEGLKKGITEGLIGQVHLLQRFLRVPQSPHEQLAVLSPEELQDLVKDLEARALPSDQND